ncbi:MAG: DUF2480 family protein [Lewinella sp.]|nr:DUF2480 family protein [Lewinella sp.]
MDKPLVNRVADSGLITLKLEDFFPAQEIVIFDLKDYLYMELILKEKDFREALKEHDWTQYQEKILLVDCSTDAIIPQWAYMLVASYAAPFAADIYQGGQDEYYRAYFFRVLDRLDYEAYRDQRIVVKGCSDRPVPAGAYLELTRRLQPLARSIMYGEPCSTVPIYKRPKEQ